MLTPYVSTLLFTKLIRLNKTWDRGKGVAVRIQLFIIMKLLFIICSIVHPPCSSANYSTLLKLRSFAEQQQNITLSTFVIVIVAHFILEKAPPPAFHRWIKTFGRGKNPPGRYTAWADCLQNWRLYVLQTSADTAYQKPSICTINTTHKQQTLKKVYVCCM